MAEYLPHIKRRNFQSQYRSSNHECTWGYSRKLPRPTQLKLDQVPILCNNHFLSNQTHRARNVLINSNQKRKSRHRIQKKKRESENPTWSSSLAFHGNTKTVWRACESSESNRNFMIFAGRTRERERERLHWPTPMRTDFQSLWIA